MTSARTGPLADLRILDLTQALAGPFCTMLLADLGADVVKIEPPRGDMTRGMPPFPADRAGCDYGGYFASINRNKRSVVLDLRAAGDRSILLRLVERADTVVENARVGVMDRLGVGYERLRERNPRLVYAAIRGFGDPRTGRSPYAEWPAFDIVAQCMGGVVGTTGPAGSAGVPCGSSVGDLFPGTLAALGIVAAVHAARRTGVGQFLDVAMYDALLTLCENVVYNFSYEGRVLGPKGTGHLSLCPFDVFETSDGAVAIAAPTDNHWTLLCEAMGRPGLAADPRYDHNLKRVAVAGEVRAIVTAWTRRHTKREVVAALGGKVPVGPVNTAQDIFEDPHPKARGMLVEVEQPGNNPPVVLAGPAIKLAATPAAIYRRPPCLGEHTAEVLAEAGIDAVPAGVPRRKERP
ncbi:MAG: CoA transferase [Deltaproteobacteria bacterium]|nr:MAG: CoA transferase [Deltaproteobacteria bacterium]